MWKKPATEQEAAAAIAAFNAFVDLWNGTPRDRRHVIHARTHQVAAGPFVGEYDEEHRELNPDIAWPVELLADAAALRRCRDRQCIRPRAAVPGHRAHQYVRFALPDGTTFDLRTRGGWRPFEPGTDRRRPLAPSDVRVAWVLAPAPARR